MAYDSKEPNEFAGNVVAALTEPPDDSPDSLRGPRSSESAADANGESSSQSAQEAEAISKASLEQSETRDAVNSVSSSIDKVTTPRVASPYPGLRPCSIDTRAALIGRSAEIAQVIERLSQQSLVAVVGPAGCGKSSLIRAGVVPELDVEHATGDEQQRYRVLVMKPGWEPVRTLAKALALLGREEQHRRLLVVDQLEELFRFSDEHHKNGKSEAKRFLRALLKAIAPAQAEGGVQVVLTMRDNYLPQCEFVEHFAEALNAGLYSLPRLDRTHFRDAVRKPAHSRDWQVPRNLVKRIVKEVGNGADALPRLQHVLDRAWQKAKPQDSELTAKAYELAGGASGAIALEGEQLIDGNEKALSPLTLRETSIARTIFQRLSANDFSQNEQSEPALSRTPATCGELAELCGLEMPDSALSCVLERFRVAGFIDPAPEAELSADTYVDISSEVILAHWPRLKKWASEEAEDAQTYLRLLERAKRFAEDAQLEPLMKGRQLSALRSWWKAKRPTTTWAERYRPQGMASNVGFAQVEHFYLQSETEWNAEVAALEATEAQQGRAQQEATAELKKQAINGALMSRRLARTRAGLVGSVLALCAALFVTTSLSGQRDVAIASASAEVKARSKTEHTLKSLETSQATLVQRIKGLSQTQHSLKSSNQELRTQATQLTGKLRLVTDKNQKIEERDRLLTVAHDRALRRSKRSESVAASALTAQRQAVGQVQAARQEALRAEADAHQARSSAATLLARVNELASATEQARRCQTDLGRVNRRLRVCQKNGVTSEAQATAPLPQSDTHSQSAKEQPATISRW